VEFAFGVPLLLFLLLGTLDLGQLFFDYVQLRNAVREGAAYGSRTPLDEAGI
jgi:Flp pilus assembly protein TadG